jgi:hypothetical protein
VGFTGIVNNSEIPREYNLSQNYPNPFNPVTQITFDLPKKGFVSLKVYDIRGSEVQTIYNRTLDAGKYVETFDALNLPSGIYFYKIVTEGLIETKKMILVK